MNAIKRNNAQRVVMLFAAFFLFSTSVWAQEIELTDQQQSQLDQNIAEATERLELTDEQAAPVEEIIRNSMIERFLILDKYGINPNDPNFQRPEMSTLSSMRDEMGRLDGDIKKQLKSHLTKDQMKAWKKLERERQKRMRSQMMGR